MASDDAVRPKTLKTIIRNFAPAWFAVIMGTGAVANLFHVFPYHVKGFEYLSLIFFALNLILFLLFSALTLSRHVMYREVWRIMLHHPVQSLYLGTFPMGVTTLLNVALTIINQKYQIGGTPFLYTLWALWWLDVGLSILCCWGMVHFMYTAQKHALEKMTAVWLLPVVTLIVASSSGGLLAKALEGTYALVTAAVSVFLVTIGLTLACMMLTVYLLRLIVHGIPQGVSVISVFLPLGPTGQAGFSILLAGEYYKHALPLASKDSEFFALSSVGDIVYVFCVAAAFMLWALASMWVGFALLGVQSVMRQGRIPFKVSVWGLIFPNAVYANLTISLANTFASPFFRVWGSIYAGITLLLWIFVAWKTVVHVRDGQIFEAPCLDEMNLAGARPVPADCQQNTENTITNNGK